MSLPPSSDRQGNTKISVQYHQGSAQYFMEQLSDRVGMQMMLILGGEFTMGAPETELYSENLERPQHEVTVPTFFMGKYPVTQEQWRIVAKFPQITRELTLDPSEFKGDDRPVEQINWYLAKEFCGRLSNYTNKKYRLPSEAEWEYACRAITTTPFHFGDTITTDLANYRGTDGECEGKFVLGNYGRGDKGIYREETTPVGNFPPNSFGLCDMHGNIWEWCEDFWHENYRFAPNNGSYWTTNGNSRYRAVRGGSHFRNPSRCRSASRNKIESLFDFNGIGFRVVCEISSVTS